MLACGLVLLGFAVARDHLLGDAVDEEPSVDEAEAAPAKPAKRKKKRPKRTRTAQASAVLDDDWEHEFDDPGIVIGDIRERTIVEEPEEAAPAPPPPYVPSAREYQPSGAYTPNAAWAEPGAETGATMLDFSSGKSNAPLDEAQVKSVLDVRRVAPCYDPWVQKIPQMQGRMHLTFVVAEDGHVAAVRVTRSELRSRVVEECVVQRARQLKFPRSAGGKTKFTTHFDFTNR